MALQIEEEGGRLDMGSVGVFHYSLWKHFFKQTVFLRTNCFHDGIFSISRCRTYLFIVKYDEFVSRVSERHTRQLFLLVLHFTEFRFLHSLQDVDRFLKQDSHLPNFFYLLQGKPFKNGEKCVLINNLNTFFFVLKMFLTFWSYTKTVRLQR